MQINAKKDNSVIDSLSFYTDVGFSRVRCSLNAILFLDIIFRCPTLFNIFVSLRVEYLDG